MKVKEIFKKYGEERFRSLEQECANWIENSRGKHFNILCGGFYKVNNINKLGVVVLLDASFDWIYNRLLTAPNSKSKLKKSTSIF